MMWAKAQPKKLFNRPRLALMTIYATTICLISLTAFAGGNQFQVTQKEAEAKIAEELAAQGVEGELQVAIMGRRSTDLMTYETPVVMEITTLQRDANTNRFTAMLAFSTEAAMNQPARALGRMEVAGRYETMVDVPVVKFRMTQTDVIRAEDIEWQKLPATRVKRDAVLEEASLIGKSPVRTISAGRPLLVGELQSPRVIVRNTPVQMEYQTQHIAIRAIGTAMQDGSVGDRIKVRNDDSGVEVDAMVLARGKVQVMPAISVPLQVSMN